MQFEWDERKNVINQRKHGVSFNEAIRAFFDPLRATRPGNIVDGEERWETFGTARGTLLLMVVHTIWEDLGEGEPVEVHRIISARPATLREKRNYENENG